MKLYYQVACHVFSVELPVGASVLDEMGQYAPFSVAQTDDVVFSLKVVSAEDFPSINEMTVEMNQDDDGSQILAGHVNGQPYFEFQLRGRCAARMLTDRDYRKAKVLLVDEHLFGINNALMVMYALATSRLQTALFHSSVVSCGEHAYMFLGKSGTGKSTHSQLWINNIEGCSLLNDDNPVLRVMEDGEVHVFGSPWSGKTLCYHNIDVPVGAIVNLHQAKKNAIRRMSLVEAYAAMYVSFSGYRFIKEMADGLHATNEKVVSAVPCYALDCLPNAEAAWLCYKTVTQ